MRVCRYQNKHGEYLCINGSLWVRVYSECDPPDQRQYHSPCPDCNTKG